MALSSCPERRFIDDSSLEAWEKIDSGGFGNVYKVRHSQWCSHVAIKLLHSENNKSLLREINMMLQGSSPHVIQVLGIFRGQPSFCQRSVQYGLVMELMERGSLAFLQKTLCGTPPWPLVVRLAHQVALGINFLHSLSPPVLHLDLKPSNVLLDPYLNAKLTDFGLSRCYHSNTRPSKKDTEEEGGTLPYMPPEAFNVSYKPTQASDIYSYGILLWSIVTGKKPYPNAISSIVRLQIPNGQRPSLDEIRSKVSGHAGLAVLIALMERCWEGRPDKRLSALDCTTVTEEQYKVHKHAIDDVVHQVLKMLDKNNWNQQEEGLIEEVQRVHITEASVGARAEEENAYNSVPTGNPPIQEMAGGRTANHRDRTGFKDLSSHQPASVCDGDLSRLSRDHKVKKSSVYPILSQVTSPSTVRSTLDRAKHTSQQFISRQCSFPRLFPCFNSPLPPEPHLKIDNVTGVQYGNNNIMNITSTAPQERGRRRHPSAPPSVNLPPTQPGSRRDKNGG
uniref:receptor-interacting serine/threonine-protein kinase 3-like n=1 Tax=Semicossyphus pulcher TaxID=241346 RepID=UPI0037E85446